MGSAYTSMLFLLKSFCIERAAVVDDEVNPHSVKVILTRSRLEAPQWRTP